MSTASLSAVITHDPAKSSSYGCFKHQNNGVSDSKADSMLPLFGNRVNFDSESEQSKGRNQKTYFGGYTPFEVFCIILIALSGLSILILLVAWGPIMSIHLKYWSGATSETPKNPPNDPQTKRGDSDGVGQNEIVHITSLNDFNQIDETTVTKSIQRLELLGPVSEDALSIIFEEFNLIRYLHVDVDKSCNTDPNERNNNKAPVIEMPMPMLTSVFVNNSEKCKIFDWTISLETPRLKKFKAVDTILELDNFNLVKQFLSHAQNSLEEIEITRSFICKDCDISDVQYDNLIKMTVNKRRTKANLLEPI
ncbi:uncharacterized protein LOC110863191 isoform X2 [Folsomia candida]|uniref:Uncharacterized protein n=1 Tax=Folsomia candida TaxID=158441 RepID=A0A226EVI9_FOLCA|nr:uncharacterized protein LOC110863191 isoform X2 [Folsomia candida]OXA61220.1 hypothetical protein Fcan01_03152 [Folsomia candida]